MRFKKGTQVEVFSNKDGPSGSWRRAEIVSGNGRSYMVRCDGDVTVLEKISRKNIRPCPPLSEISDNWGVGDVVEVLDCFSWKMATICNILSKSYFLVRLLGSSLEYEVSKYGIRARQSWRDNKWIVIGRGSVSCEDSKRGRGFTLNYYGNSRNAVQMSQRKQHFHARDACSSEVNKVTFLGSNTPSNKILKRGHYSHLQVEAYDGAPYKLRAIEKEGGKQRVFISNQSLQPEKVDRVSFPVEKVGEINIRDFDNRTGLSVLEAERRKSADAVGCSFASRDAHGVTSSVGSCSITSDSPNRLHCHSGFVEDFNRNGSDAESCYRGEYEEGNIHPTEEELAAEIHRLELYAYRCTMEALHASGPLSWEQESMVTNLRLSLHISNDEHLMEGRTEKHIDLASKCGTLTLGLLPLLGLENFEI